MTLAPIVLTLGWRPDQVDAEGDIFTAACLESIGEPTDAAPIFFAANDTRPQTVVMSYGEWKRLPRPRPTLHAGFLSHLDKGECALRINPGGEVTGRIFYRICAIWLALSRGDASEGQWPPPEPATTAESGEKESS